MPRVKVDYIVSFSSEDSDNQASNLLALEVCKKKWLCSKGESSCSVVLQLTRAVKISAVHIGAHHAAFVEVLVGRSEKPNEEFQVLVPKSVFLSPSESRRDEPVERVRSFSTEQLVSPARDQRWDRARVVCSQPHNKHCKYGLSFVHIYEPESTCASAPPAASSVPSRVLALDTFSSDEDDFKPGDLFAKHLQKPTADTQSNSSDTGAQIRQATSLALKNLSDSATKLMKTPIAKTASKRQSHADDRGENRQRPALLYTDDDDRPHAKIDHVVQRHNDQKSKEESCKGSDKKEKLNNTVDSHKDDKRYSRKESNNIDLHREDKRDSNEGTGGHSSMRASNTRSKTMTNEHRNPRDDNNSSRGAHSNKNNDNTANNSKDDNESRKRSRPDCDREKKERASSSPHTLLQGAVLVLSGYENPRRAALRQTALALGARVQRDWGPGCTHLICAFPNTPKLRAVRSAAGGGSVPAARGEWLEHAARRRRRLPWRRYAPRRAAARCRRRAASGWSTRRDAAAACPGAATPRGGRRLGAGGARRVAGARGATPPPPALAPLRPAAGGGSVPAARGEWLEHAARRRRRLPWRRYATEPRQRAPPDNDDDGEDHDERPADTDPDCDTDEEIEKVLRNQKKHKANEPPRSSRDRSPAPASGQHDSTKHDRKSPEIRQNKINCTQTNSSSTSKPSRYSIDTIIIDSDLADENPTNGPVKEFSGALPDFFDGYSFVIDEEAIDGRFDVPRLTRYIRAYGGVLLEASQLSEDSEVSYVLCTKSSAVRQAASGACAVRPDWVWRCHEARALLPAKDYALG